MRHGVTAAAAGVALSVVVAGCADAGDPVMDASPTATAEATSEPAPTTTASPGTVAAACGQSEEPQLQSGSHLVGDAEPPVPYSSSPPTSGWHASGERRLGVIPPEDPLTKPQLVSALEGGHVVAAYDPAGLSEDDVAELTSLAEGEFAGQLTVTPYADDMDGAALTLTGWGVLQRCDGVAPDVIESFVAAHATQDPDELH